MFRIFIVLGLMVTIARAEEGVSELPIINTKFTEKVQRLANGLSHQHVYADSGEAGAPISIHILRADLDWIALRPTLAMGQVVGQEATSSMVKRHGALAGVNGGFSYSNNPWSIYHGDLRGFFALDGQLISEPNAGAWSVQIQTPPNKRQIFSLVQPELRIGFKTQAGAEIVCSGLNREQKEADCIVYTPVWNRTTLTDTLGVEVVVDGGRVTAVREGMASATIPPKGFVVSARGERAAQLRKVVVGVTADVAFDLVNLADNKPLPLENHHYVSAGPLLVREGKPVPTYEGEHWFHKPPFTHARHPRTAIGWSRDGREVMLVTVDGRQPGHSVGFTLPELAQFLADRGAYTAYNMDGGGSTAMAIGGEVVNRFSDVWGGRLGEKPIERRRCDALLLFSR